MITVLLHMTVKAEREDAFREMVPRLTQTTHAEDPGCIAYAFYCRADNRNEAVLYEQWKDADALNAHVARLVRVLGPPDDQEPYPPTVPHPVPWTVVKARTQADRGGIAR